jgi:DNA repair photolyase
LIPSDRFIREDGQPRIIRIKAKRAFTPTKIPGADYVINQYVGCQNACRYCYAKFMGRFYPYGEWGRWVVVKENLPELVRRERIKGTVYMSSVSDPYQPIEKELLLTRRILQNMDKRTKFPLQPKGYLNFQA